MSEAKAFVLQPGQVCLSTPVNLEKTNIPSVAVLSLSNSHTVNGVDALIELIRACEYALEAKHTLYTADDVKRFYELNNDTAN